MRIAATLFVLALCGTALLAQEDGEKPGDLVRFQGIEIDLAKREIRIEGRFLLDRGLVELFATAEGGKEHESILALACKPNRLQTGLILLGLEKGTGVRFQGEKATPTGSLVDLLVRWKDAEGKEKEAFAEDLVWDTKQGRAMPRAGWVFAGSRFVTDPGTGAEVFMADISGSMVVTFHDPDAILDTPAAEGADDTVYAVHTEAVPPPGTKATLVVRPRDGAAPGRDGGDGNGDEGD
ncbi:MAG: hypothetical protein HY720_12895 [Planctomycetes bacterium]|nr:hypothetical protein [Planctomycetota bacterium]